MNEVNNMFKKSMLLFVLIGILCMTIGCAVPDSLDDSIGYGHVGDQVDLEEINEVELAEGETETEAATEAETELWPQSVYSNTFPLAFAYEITGADLRRGGYIDLNVYMTNISDSDYADKDSPSNDRIHARLIATVDGETVYINHTRVPHSVCGGVVELIYHPGEVMEDSLTILIPEDAPSGTYKLELFRGMDIVHTFVVGDILTLE